MRVLGDRDLLDLLDAGSSLHPIDRALLLCARARPEIAPARLAELPLGVVNEALIRLRLASFGERVRAYLDCERCGERLEVEIDAARFLTGSAGADERDEIEVGGFRFRAPSNRDLAAVAQERDVDAAAARILDRCCVGRPPGAHLDDVRDAAEALLETLDPVADIGLTLSCAACGHGWVAAFEIGSLLWDEIEARAVAVLNEVHELARAYGWTEREVLALSPQRRAAYLGLVRS